MSEVLDEKEIRNLTLYTHKSKQIETLIEMGIPFHIHPKKGNPIVTTLAVNQYKQHIDSEGEPNWDG